MEIAEFTILGKTYIPNEPARIEPSKYGLVEKASKGVFRSL